MKQELRLLKKQSYIFNPNHNLTHLSFRNCTFLNDQSVSLISKDCRHLDLSIHINACQDQLSDTGLKHLFTYCPYLESLDLYGRQHLSDVGLSMLSPSLKCLTFPGKNGKALSFSSIDTLTKTCPMLTSLDMSTSPFALKQFQGFTKLQYLDLSFCTQIEDLSFQKMSSLKVLNLKGMETLSDEKLITLCRNAPNLERLYLSYSTALTDQAIYHILKHLNHLQVLDLSRCIQISDKTVTGLIQDKKKLKKINLIGCPIQKSTISALKKAHPFCMVLS